MNNLNNRVWAIIGISIIICLAASGVYFYSYGTLTVSLQNSIVSTCLLFFFAALVLIIPTEINIRGLASGQQDERLRVISNKSASATLSWLIASLVCIPTFLQMRGLHTIQVNLSLIPVVAIGFVGAIFCVCFIYYYFKIS